LIAFGTANRSADLWAGMLAVQTLPYLAAVSLAIVNARTKK